MAIAYEVDAALGVVFERWTGVITAQDVGDHLARLLRDEKAVACRRSLADIRECEFEIAGAAVSELVRSAVEPALHGWHTAIVARSAVGYGIARQFEMLTEGFMRTAVFTDEASAREWIIPAE